MNEILLLLTLHRNPVCFILYYFVCLASNSSGGNSFFTYKMSQMFFWWYFQRIRIKIAQRLWASARKSIQFWVLLKQWNILTSSNERIYVFLYVLLFFNNIVWFYFLNLLWGWNNASICVYLSLFGHKCCSAGTQYCKIVVYLYRFIQINYQENYFFLIKKIYFLFI